MSTRFKYVGDREWIGKMIASVAAKMETQGEKEFAAELYQEAAELQEEANEGNQYLLLH